LKNLISILFFAFAGILLMPKVSKACGCCHQSAKDIVCSTQQVLQRTSSASCCHIHDTNDAYSQQRNSCGRNGTCNCSSNNVVSAITINVQNFIITQLKEKPKIFLSISPLLSGYSSFWQPPKIV
jgi:hypothetical protein